MFASNNVSTISNIPKTSLLKTCERPESPSNKKLQNYEDDILKKYKLRSYSLNLGRMAVQSKTLGITGEDIYKYSGKPVIPIAIPKIQSTETPYYMEHKIRNNIMQSAQRQCYTMLTQEELYKNAETQTDYRESEAQTDPWEPMCKITRGHNPEVLTLAHLTWKHGLPAGVHEIHVINRMRMKRAWEAVLPPMDTPTNIKIRNSIITALEIEEWAFRETEIQFIMDLRLNMMRDFLRNRESENEKKVQSRFNRLQNKLGQRRDNQIKTIRQNLKRDLRKLLRNHRDKQRPRKPDIIKRHVDFTSDLYAPQMRFSEHSQRWHETSQKRFLSESYVKQFSIKKEEEDTTLSWLPTITETKVIKCKSKPIDICIRETKWTEGKLKQLHADLKAIRMNVKSADKIPSLMKRNYKQPALPVTPRRSGVWNGKQKQRKESATFIQKLVRGRAVQCLMYEGRNRCKELIEEIQSTEQDHDDEIVELQELQTNQSMQEDRLCEILNSLEGKTVCETLDFLSKELVRLEDERKAHAFALLAERERCTREAAEAGRRQFERNRRREFDEMFKQIVKVNQDSVEAYLEDIIKECVDWVSDNEAKEHILEICDKADAVSKQALVNADKLKDEELVADMIYNFILPEVEKNSMRKKIRDQQQNYMQNAYVSIYEKILDLPSGEPSRITSQEEQNIEIEEIESSIHKTEIIHNLLNSIIENVIGSTNL